MARNIQVGDIFEIPLSDGRRAFGQYVFPCIRRGPIVRIFDRFLEQEQEFIAEDILSAKLLFPPVITGLFGAIRAGMWQVVDHTPVNDFEYPSFLTPRRGRDPFIIKRWFLWDGAEYVDLGKTLPEKYKELELGGVWAPGDLTKRIETGEDMWKKLIKNF